MADFKLNILKDLLLLDSQMSDSYLKSSLTVLNKFSVAFINLKEKKINIMNLKNGKIVKKINCVSQKKCIECIVTLKIN